MQWNKPLEETMIQEKSLKLKLCTFWWFSIKKKYLEAVKTILPQLVPKNDEKLSFTWKRDTFQRLFWARW